MPNPAQTALVIVTIVFFLLGGTTSLTRLWRDPPWSRLTAKACMWLGVLMMIIVLVWHSISRNSWLPLEDNFDTLIWLALVLALFVLYVQRRRPLGGLDWFVMPTVIMLLIGAVVSGVTRPQIHNIRSLWSWVHLAGAFGGAAAFAIAGATGAMYLIANYRLRHKAALGPNLGSLERLEHFTLNAVTLGFALLTIGAITGFIKMRAEHSSMPVEKVVLTSAVWLVYAIVLHSPINPVFRGRRAAVLSIVGFLLMAGTLIAVMVMPGSTG